MTGETRWFRILSGPDEGRLHLAGWLHTAIQGVDGWTALACCPRCHAMVLSSPGAPHYRDDQWAHEQWHAQTDFPIPDELKDPEPGKETPR